MLYYFNDIQIERFHSVNDRVANINMLQIVILFIAIDECNEMQTKIADS